MTVKYMNAKFAGKCTLHCGNPVEVGEAIVYTNDGRKGVVRHQQCPPRPQAEVAAPVTEEDPGNRAERELVEMEIAMAQRAKVSRPKTYQRNPWVEQAMNGETASAFGEQGVYFDEYRTADEKPTIACPAGHDAYYKPTVGAYVCPQCGAIRARDNSWIGDVLAGPETARKTYSKSKYQEVLEEVPEGDERNRASAAATVLKNRVPGYRPSDAAREVVRRWREGRLDTWEEIHRDSNPGPLTPYTPGELASVR